MNLVPIRILFLFVFLVSVRTLESQVNYSFSLNSILNAMPNGLKMPDGTIVKAEKISIGTGVHNANSGNPGPVFDGQTFTGTTLPAYVGSKDPTSFTLLQTSSAATVDNGRNNNCANAISFRIYFDRPTLFTSFLAIDVDGDISTSDPNVGSAEWISCFAFNDNVFVPFTLTASAATQVVPFIITVGAAHTWRNTVSNIINTTAATAMPGSIAGRRLTNTGSGLSPDNINGQALFNPTSTGTPVTNFFIAWGIWPTPATPTAQCVGLSPIVVGLSASFSDLPDSYKTLLASGGPSHGIVSTLKLGASNPIEANGNPSVLANTSAGDDGVLTIIPIPDNGTLSQILNNYSLSADFINNTGLAANFVAWIDWNNNGSFEPSEGQTITTPAGTTSSVATFTWNNVTLSGPAGLKNTYARIRVTTESITTTDVGGAFKDGEVEDYSIPFDIALPLQLLSFSGSEQDNRAVLTWQTADELKTGNFEIERSTDGMNYTATGSVKAIGSGNNSYSFTDPNILDGANYYRLKIIDIDGVFSYSKTIILRSSAGTTGLKLWPSCVTTNLEVAINASGISMLKIYNINGQLMKEIKTANARRLSINCSSLPKGFYYLQAMNEKDNLFNVRFIKQ